MDTPESRHPDANEIERDLAATLASVMRELVYQAVDEAPRERTTGAAYALLAAVHRVLEGDVSAAQHDAESAWQTLTRGR